jgi:hypothetical protein
VGEYHAAPKTPGGVHGLDAACMQLSAQPGLKCLVLVKVLIKWVNAGQGGQR